MGDAHKLEVAQFPESGVQPDKPATFLVRKNGAKGELDAKVYISFLTLLTYVATRIFRGSLKGIVFRINFFSIFILRLCLQRISLALWLLILI